MQETLDAGDGLFENRTDAIRVSEPDAEGNRFFIAPARGGAPDRDETGPFAREGA